MNRNISSVLVPVLWTLCLDLAPATAQVEVDPGVYGLWGMTCAPALPGSEGVSEQQRCAATQVVAADPSGTRVVMGTTIDYFDSASVPTIRFRFSPDAVPSHGVGVKIDNATELHLPISSCDARACEAFGRLTAEPLAAFRNGRVAQIAFISASAGQQITAPLSLAGLAEALDTLGRRMQESN